ncbi:hypothetical protein R8Z50_18060 [Longispora sp. K20-0274]|uniref:hypothetical protein n=1 Tax=Longispora sp. K20-0274 TaxID=3088255 RepID=UPI00399ABD79
MDQKAPPALLRILFVIAVVSFGVGMYLEQRQLDWLGRHPISANLLTSVIGFATGGLVVAIFFNWIRERDQARRLHEPVAEEWRALIRPAREAFGLLNTQEADALGKPDSDAYGRFVAALWGDDPIEPAEWEERVAGMRAAGPALLATADEFAGSREIDGPRYRTARAAFEQKLTARPDAFGAAATELYSFCDTVDDLHYELVRGRLRLPAVTPLARPVTRARWRRRMIRRT